MMMIDRVRLTVCHDDDRRYGHAMDVYDCVDCVNCADCADGGFTDMDVADTNRTDANVPDEDFPLGFSADEDSLMDKDSLPDCSSDPSSDSSEDAGLLDPQRVLPFTCAVADTVIALASVGSTNTFAADLVRSGGFSADGRAGNSAFAVVCADTQTAGRGRLDHTWASSAGESFIVSFVASVPVAIVRDPSVCGWFADERRIGRVERDLRDLPAPANRAATEMAERCFRGRQETRWHPCRDGADSRL